MENKFSYDPTDHLDHLQRVDAPPFLLTRIRQRTKEVYEQRVTPTFAWVSSCLLLCLFALNFYIITGRVQATDRPSHGGMTDEMRLFTNNSLYE